VDSCDQPSAARLDLVVLGQPTEGPFVALAPGDTVPGFRGGQGLSMRAVRLRITGNAAPECLAQQTTISGVSGQGTNSNPVRAYPESGGARVTEPIYVIIDADAGTTLRVETAAGGLTVSRDLIAGPEGMLWPTLDLAVVDDLGPGLGPSDLARFD
jgi:hypothetical protein